jgi:hypothetical protein
MADLIDFLRQNALRKLINGISGGNRVLWGEKDLVRLHDRVMTARLEELASGDSAVVVKSSANLVDKTALAAIGITLRDFSPSDSSFLCLITNPTIDHAGDSVKPDGVDCSLFDKNAPVLDSHDSSKAPIATSSKPFMSGNNLLAIAKFPATGVSANSDQIAAAVRARLVKGVSVGFLPTVWSFSKDPARKLGINFDAVKLLEFSTCSLPMNPDCRILGSVANNQAAPADGKMADRRREARLLADQARSLAESITVAAPQTRDQRMAEARNLRRIAMEINR